MTRHREHGTHPEYQRNHDRYIAKREYVLEQARIRRLELIAGQETLRQRNRRREAERRQQRALEARGREHLLKWREGIGMREYVRDYKEANPCTDCGASYPFYVMDFDHVLGEKKDDISRLVSRRAGMVSRETVLNEIAKCELVCANCHRRRTFRRFEKTIRKCA